LRSIEKLKLRAESQMWAWMGLVGLRLDQKSWRTVAEANIRGAISKLLHLDKPTPITNPQQKWPENRELSAS
jgi:hypothetical protein